MKEKETKYFYFLKKICEDYAKPMATSFDKHGKEEG